MLRERIVELFKDRDPKVQAVIARVIEEEWKRLSYRQPRGILDEIKHIIDAEVRSDED